ncbi:hypothetical protein BV20DRAFT_169915 [Pilatotrama ljubarskyi]|nr:hypothetical protein BV20DRAFT_169915 [Pilatotrama ljubarskyi]
MRDSSGALDWKGESPPPPLITDTVLQWHERGGIFEWWLPARTGASSYPYATRCPHEDHPTPTRCLSIRLACGQDAEGRDIIFKLVDCGTMEYQIYKHLSNCDTLYAGDSPVCVLPPTAIIESPYQFAFVAMPMWGARLSIQNFDRIRQVLAFIRSTLTGLSFLHEQRIAHRDIHETNILVNWYCGDDHHESCARRLSEHTRSRAAAYALFDFDLSLQLPQGTDLRRCHRPALEAFTGKRTYHPADVYQGESHYNPFAFDVACLGNLYLYHFAEAIPTVPLLAPLFAKMSTHVIDDRFDAREALDFFSQIEAGLPLEVLDEGVVLQPDFDPLDDPNLCWSRLTHEFHAAWQIYRPPPLSWITHLLRWIASTHTGCRVPL